MSPLIKTPYASTNDLGNLKFNNFNGNDIIDITDLNKIYNEKITF